MAEMWNESSLSPTRPIFWTEASSKRQVFLRSYQFSRKRSLSDRIKASLLRVKRLAFWFRLRPARKLRRFVWARLWSKLRQRRPPSSRLRFVRLADAASSFPCFC